MRHEKLNPVLQVQLFIFICVTIAARLFLHIIEQDARYLNTAFLEPWLQQEFTQLIADQSEAEVKVVIHIGLWCLHWPQQASEAYQWCSSSFCERLEAIGWIRCTSLAVTEKMSLLLWPHRFKWGTSCVFISIIRYYILNWETVEGVIQSESKHSLM